MFFVDSGTENQLNILFLQTMCLPQSRPFKRTLNIAKESLAMFQARLNGLDLSKFAVLCVLVQAIVLVLYIFFYYNASSCTE